MKKKFYLLPLLMLSVFAGAKAQYVTGAAPVQDGTVNAGEYYGGNSGAWSMCWDDNFLYLALTGGQSNEPGIAYFDFNANTAANGGVAVGTNGSVVGKNDYGSTPNLPFVSNTRIFFATNLNGSQGLYAEITYNTGTGWGTPTTITTVLGTSSGTVRELKLSWTQLRNGTATRPSAFNWLGTASSLGGFIYNPLPSTNYVGNGSNTPTYYFYQTVDNTTASNTSNSLSANFTSFSNYNASFDYNNGFPANLYDISLGKSGSIGNFNIQRDITLRGSVAVYNGTLQVTNGSGKNINMAGTSQLIKIFGTSGGNVTGTDIGPGNDLTLNVTAGTTTIDGDATANFDNEKKFFNVNVDAGATLALSRGILVRYGSFNVTGTLQINANGYVQQFIPSNAAATYINPASRLIYNSGGNYNATDYEWPTTNNPANVTIQNSNTNVILNNNKSISGSLTLTTGKITTGTNSIEILSGGTVSRTSGWVYGTMKRGFGIGSNISLTYDIGDLTDWTPATVILGSVTAAGNISLATVAAQHPNYATSNLSQTKYVKRYWIGNVGGASFTNGQIQFNYLNTDLQNGASENFMKVLQFDGTSWLFVNRTVATSAYTVTFGNLSASGNLINQSFAAGECVNDIVLPGVSANTPVCVGATLTLTGNAVTSGGVGAFTYTWGGPNAYVGNGLVANLTPVLTTSAGSYTLTATDAIGCNSTQSVSVSLRFPSTSSTSITICPNELPFTWNGLTFNAAGSQTAHFTNAVGCDSAATLNLIVSRGISATFTKTDVTCSSGSDGSITMNPTSSFGPFTYRIGVDGPIAATSNIFTGLKAGSYRIYVQNSKGCVGVIAPVNINQPNEVTATVTPTNLTCYGSNDGKLTISNVVGVAPFKYKSGTSGSYSSFTPPATISGLRPGDYRLYIQDANACLGTTGVATVLQAQQLSATFSKVDITCGTSTGSITVIKSGGPSNPPYTYKLGSSAYLSNATFSGLKAGNYTGYVKDANGCIGRTPPIALPAASGCLMQVVARNNKPFTMVNANSSQSLSLLLYPNPTINQFVVKAQSSKILPLSIKVTDAYGRSIYEAKGMPEQSIRFGDKWPNGLYLIEVKQGDETKTVKAVKGK